MWLGESNIWKMTTSNDLSKCAGWCAQYTFFFSTVAELQLSVRWPNAIEAPYGQSNVISQAFILCLLLDREEPRRDAIWIGDGCWREAAIEQGMEGHNACDASCSLDVDRRREGQRKKTRIPWGQVIIIRLSVKHHWPFGINCAAK